MTRAHRFGALLLLAVACQRQESLAGPITERGLGPLRIGMSMAQTRATFPGVRLGDGMTGGCAWGSFAELPAGVSMMVENDTVARIDVDSSTVATREGARVGDSEDRIRSLYGTRVTVLPHKYTDGHYLVVTSASDTLHRIVFETEKGKVTTYRVGKRPQVEYVERCS